MIFQTRPTVIGHRGAGATSDPRRIVHAEPAGPAGPAGPVAADPPAERPPENTMESFLAAVDAGLDWIEIDVQRSADDRLVLRHDPTLADGGHIIDRTAERTCLPLLAEVFDALPPHVAIDVDVKTVIEDAVDSPGRRTGALLVPLLAREARRRRLLVTSFDPSLLVHLKEQVPGLALGLLTWLRFPVWHAVPAAAGLGLQAVAVHTASCGLDAPDARARPLERSVEVAHQAGLEFVVWCPGAEDAPRYAEAGVDAMVVNDVPGVLSALSAPATR